MPANSGRRMVVRRGGTPLASMREKSVAMSRSFIDITTDDEGAAITLLDGAANAASEQVTISCSGVANANVLRQLGLATGGDALLNDITILLTDVTPNVVVTGNFGITAYEESGSYQDTVVFSWTMVSSGAVTVAPA